MRWESIFAHGPDPALVIENGRVVAANLAAGAFLEAPTEALVGRPLRDVLLGGAAAEAALAVPTQEAAAEGAALRLAGRVRTAGGRELDVEVSMTGLPGTPRRTLLGLHGTAAAGAERGGAAGELRTRAGQVRTLLHNFPNGAVVLFDSDLRLTVADSAALAAAGFPRESVEGRPIGALVPVQTFALVEPSLRAALAGRDSELEVPFAGRVFGVAVHPVSGAAGEPWGGMAVVQDITARKHLDEKLRYLSVHDPLTNLFNRLFFEEEMARLAKGRHYPISVVVADLDGLGGVNGRLGHAAGDELLRQGAEMLRSSFRPGDVVARIGGDEFAILLPGAGERAGESALLRVRRSEEARPVGDGRLVVRFSLGLATANEGDSLAETLRLADSRMCADKVARASRA